MLSSGDQFNKKDERNVYDSNYISTNQLIYLSINSAAFNMLNMLTGLK